MFLRPIRVGGEATEFVSREKVEALESAIQNNGYENDLLTPRIPVRF